MIINNRGRKMEKHRNLVMMTMSNSNHNFPILTMMMMIPHQKNHHHHPHLLHRHQTLKNNRKGENENTVLTPLNLLPDHFLEGKKLAILPKRRRQEINI